MIHCIKSFLDMKKYHPVLNLLSILIKKPIIGVFKHDIAVIVE